MLATVRARILFFALLSLGAVAGLTFLSWMIIVKAETTSNQLVNNGLEESWVLTDLEQDHRQLQDLAYKIKAQLLLWDEIDPEFKRLQASLDENWQQVLETPGLAGWASENSEKFDGVLQLVADMAPGIAERSYYQVGKVIDFKLFPGLEPMLKAINERQQINRDEVSSGARELLEFLSEQQNLLVVGALVFLIIVVVMTLWLRRSVILRLHGMVSQLSVMEKNADLSNVPVPEGRDEVAGVARAIAGLVRRFDQFVGDIRTAAGSLDERSTRMDAGAEALQQAAENTRKQIADVNSSMSAIADQASQIEQATEQSASTVAQALTANGEVSEGLNQSERGAEHTVEVITRVSDSIHTLNESTSKIEQVISVIADIAEQTNLLALNAAIEAARAGEHGRGFAVVADEVRTLSRRTAESTGSIRQWVQDLVQGVSGVDSLLDEMRSAGAQNHTNLLALKTHLEALAGQFDELEQQSHAIRDAVTVQRDEIGRVGRRAAALSGSAETLTGNVEDTRIIGEALRQESLTMRNLAAVFQTRA